MPQTNDEPEKLEEFTDDLYLRFKHLLQQNDEEAIEIYRQMIVLLDKRRDEEMSVPHDMEPDLSPADYRKMHEDAA